jgi:hypothetical protein
VVPVVLGAVVAAFRSSNVALQPAAAVATTSAAAMPTRAGRCLRPARARVGEAVGTPGA